MTHHSTGRIEAAACLLRWLVAREARFELDATGWLTIDLSGLDWKQTRAEPASVELACAALHPELTSFFVQSAHVH